MSAQHEGASWFAERDKPVFPLHWTDEAGACSCGDAECANPGKHPYGRFAPNGFHDATTDLAKIDRWWKHSPNANIGLPTGPASGIYVADFDSKSDQGRAIIAALKRDAGLLVDGCMVETPGKPPNYVPGLHVYLWSDADAGTRSIGVGELKGSGGYVLVPPSQRAGRLYRFLTSRRRYTVDDPLAWIRSILDSFGIEIPEQAPGPELGPGWAAEWLRTPRPPDTRRAPDGLPRMVGHLRGRGVDVDTATAILELWDASNPVPLGPEEVRKHVEGMYDRYGHPGGATLSLNGKHPPATPGALSVTMIADVASEPVTWLWRGYIPLGKLTMLDGDPGLGKSTLTLELAARATRGRLMPDLTAGDLEQAADVVLLTAEDGLADTIRPRLEAAGADLARVHAINGRTTTDGYADIVTLPDDVAAVEVLVREHSARLVIIDPLMAFLGGQTNSFRDQDVRRALAPIAAMADRTGAAVLVVRHLNKSGGSNPLYRGGGSIGIIGAARSGLLVAPDPDDAERRIIVVTKSNLAARMPAMAFRIEALGEVARIEWDGATDHKASDLLDAPYRESNGLTPAIAEGVRFLRDVLCDGPVATKQVNAEARSVGISAASLRRAREHLGIASERVGGVGDDGEWRWKLPGGAILLTVSDNEQDSDVIPENPHENQETAISLKMSKIGGLEQDSEPVERLSAWLNSGALSGLRVDSEKWKLADAGHAAESWLRYYDTYPEQRDRIEDRITDLVTTLAPILNGAAR